MLLGGALVAGGGQMFFTSASAAGLSGVSPRVAPALVHEVDAGVVNARGWAAHHDGDKHHDRDGRGKERSDKDEDRKDDDHEGRRKTLDQRVVSEIKQLLG
jgi:hypothetical protein